MVHGLLASLHGSLRDHRSASPFSDPLNFSPCHSRRSAAFLEFGGPGLASKLPKGSSVHRCAPIQLSLRENNANLALGGLLDPSFSREPTQRTLVGVRSVHIDTHVLQFISSPLRELGENLLLQFIITLLIVNINREICWDFINT